MFIKHQLLLKLCLSLWEAKNPPIQTFYCVCHRLYEKASKSSMSHNQHVISHDAFRCPCIKGIKAGFDATKLLPKARPVYCFNDGTGTVQICQVNQC